MCVRKRVTHIVKQPYTCLRANANFQTHTAAGGRGRGVGMPLATRSALANILSAGKITIYRGVTDGTRADLRKYLTTRSMGWRIKGALRAGISRVIGAPFAPFFAAAEDGKRGAIYAALGRDGGRNGKLKSNNERRRSYAVKN